MCKAGAFISMHHFSPWHSPSKLSSAHLAYRNGSLSCTISRHGIVQASLTLLIWLIEMAAFKSDVGWSLRRTTTTDISTNSNHDDKPTQTHGNFTLGAGRSLRPTVDSPTKLQTATDMIIMCFTYRKGFGHGFDLASE